jgi:hypothetical protein
MKNLQNYGVQELNARELQTTDGGCECPGGSTFASRLGRGIARSIAMLIYATAEAVKIVMD